MNKLSKKEAGKLGSINSVKTANKKKNSRIESYNRNPVLCKFCNNSLEYEKRHNTFCNSSCFASYNNKSRESSPEFWQCLSCGKKHEVIRGRYGKYCGMGCHKDHQYSERVSRWLKEGEDWDYQTPNWARRYISETRGHLCEICGIHEWLGNPITLECDHIDGNYRNNKENNLRLLCPNCHSQTPTYKAKNKGNGRIYRRNNSSD